VDEKAKIREFIVEEFMPEMSPDELEDDFDLQTGGAVDSLGLLKLVAWLESEYGISVDESELGPESLRTVNSINEFINERREPANA
jgi:acyl carrier protein